LVGALENEIGLPERRGREGYAKGAKEDKREDKRNAKIRKIKRKRKMASGSK
jgi:hypothetical protein